MSLDRIFNSATQLPTVPKIVQELIDSFQNEDVDIDTITEKLSLDPALTAKVLRMANSAHFGGSRKISSVNEAVVLLGFNSLRTLVMASGITGAFNYPRSFDKKLFWKNSFEMAAVCKVLAKSSAVDPETAFTCGMLSDIGTILMITTFPVEVGEVLSAASKGASRQELEQKVFNFTAPEVSAGLASRWRFPTVIADALRWQRMPQESQGSALAYLLALGNFLHERRLDCSEEELCEQMPKDLVAGAGLKMDKLKAAMGKIKELDTELDGLFD